MLRYSELSKSQKAIIKAMKSGNVLQWHSDTMSFYIHGIGLPYKLAAKSVNALKNRGYIEEWLRDKNFIRYSINVEFLTSDNLKAMEQDK
jgi:hypothetical protein